MKAFSILSKGGLIGLAMVAIVAGCTKANDVANKIGGPTEKEAKSLALQSVWKTGCEKTAALAELFNLPSQTTELDFGSSHSSTTKLFREDNCQTPAIGIVENGRYTLGDKTATDIYTLDVHYDSVAVTPINDDGTNTLNGLQACGFADWKTGVAKDVTAKSSSTPVVSRCWIKTPRDVYDLVMITGDQIKLGLVKDGKDKTSIDKRPTEIDQSNVLTK